MNHVEEAAQRAVKNAVAKAERIYTRMEDRADSIVHVIGVLFAINAGVWLLFNVTGLSVLISVSVYCVGLFCMLSASAAYNMMPRHRPSKQILRRLDHAAIFIMIAATYTPFAVNRLDGTDGTLILSAIWLCAMAGVAMKLLYPRRFELFAVGLYLGMGWMVVTVIRPLSETVASTGFWLLVAGGLVYSAGVAFYLIERIPYHKAIWHAFVLAAAVLHFAAIASEFAA